MTLKAGDKPINIYDDVYFKAMDIMNAEEEDIMECSKCGAPTDIYYNDTGVLGMVHGDCFCRRCYIENGYLECPNCGRINSKGWKYCPDCGYKLEFSIGSEN